MNSLTNRVNYADTVLLVVSGSPDLPIALSESVQNLLRRISLTFGDGWWDHLVIGVSNWPYDEESIIHRKDECEQFPDFCKDEDNFREKFGNEIKEELGLVGNLIPEQLEKITHNRKIRNKGKTVYFKDVIKQIA